MLSGHRVRFNQQFKVLHNFYNNTRNLQYFKTLIQVPHLPQVPPNFLIEAELRSHVAPVVVLEEEQPDPADVVQESVLIDTSEPSPPPVPPHPHPDVVNSHNGPMMEALAERETLIDALQEELRECRNAIQTVRSESSYNQEQLKLKINDLESTIAELTVVDFENLLRENYLYWTDLIDSNRFWKLVKGELLYWTDLIDSNRFWKLVKGELLYWTDLIDSNRFWKLVKGELLYWTDLIDGFILVTIFIISRAAFLIGNRFIIEGELTAERQSKESVLAQVEAAAASAEAVTKLAEEENKRRMAEEKFVKMKEVYQKLREEHIALIRVKAEIEKTLAEERQLLNLEQDKQKEREMNMRRLEAELLNQNEIQQSVYIITLFLLLSLISLITNWGKSFNKGRECEYEKESLEEKLNLLAREKDDLETEKKGLRETLQEVNENMSQRINELESEISLSCLLLYDYV
ncbi:hypothetical protein Avbf_06216 [Armadillidium vulgare]|nr:hypothetical protein Avbf_06216 [Armadillidium vulgare]